MACKICISWMSFAKNQGRLSKYINREKIACTKKLKKMFKQKNKFSTCNLKWICLSGILLYVQRIMYNWKLKHMIL